MVLVPGVFSIFVCIAVVLVVLVVAVVVVVVVDFPPSPAGSCPSYHSNASSPKMLRGNDGQFFNFIFCQFKRLFIGWGEGKKKQKLNHHPT